MNIRYVVSSMVFWGRENYLTLEQDCELLKSLGFGIEFWPNSGGICSCRFERKNWSRLKNATEGMLVLLRSRNDCPTIEQWIEQIECAAMLNANIVMGLQSFGVPDKTDIDGCDFSNKIIQTAAEFNVKLALETGNLKKLLRLGDRFPTLTYCFDVGYVNKDKEFSFTEYVDKLAPRVTHLHLTDNYGITDDHTTPGLDGGISKEKWQYLLEVISRYDNEIIGSLEMCPPSPAVMIDQAGKFIFEQLNWPNKPENLNRLIELIISKK